ncbi:hypothetical protein LOY55_13780 [Pseudomonas sp. B21-040]|uniref:lysozyme inhibitor LprI family protein n=1 Tax=Pseudomonas sp. B21-040 TaxID=2895486 RepID=UPI00215F8D61|nr:lysozyme inhibitor LprI family protein [Pseudomonas sp. B21-040]UVL43102.1 hypothetical protein LOY55_13780 [Pseudomonas sp. B21-040]
MASKGKLLLDERVAQVRSRLRVGRADGAIYEATVRINDLERSLKTLKDTKNTELFRHFPVAAVATLEAHFRSSVAMVVDKGGEYFTRGVALVGDRLKASEIIPMIHKQSVSVGEIVAYSLPFSSLSHLEDVFDALLGQKFKQLSKSAKDPYFTRNDVPGGELIVGDVSRLWLDLHQAFHDRHVLAHESATQFFMDYDKAASAVNSVKLIIEITEAVFWSTVWKDEPLTQYEMNVAAWERYKNIRIKLAAAIRKKRKEHDDCLVASRFRELHFKWKDWVTDWCSFSADRFVGGSIRPLIHASELSQSFEDRIKQVESVTGF